MERERRNGESKRRNTHAHTYTLSMKKGKQLGYSFGNFSAHMTQNENNFTAIMANETIRCIYLRTIVN